MGRPLLFIDFDGVINQFPDDKVMRRQGRTGWMRPDDPHRAAYAPDNWFRPDRRERLLVRDLGRRFVIRWNAELVARLDALDADKWWLTTWQPETGRLNRALGVDWPTIRWYDPITVLLQCLFDRFGSVFPQCGLMVFPGVVIVSR